MLSGLSLGVPGGVFSSQKWVKKRSCYKTAIRARFGVDFGRVLGSFLGRFFGILKTPKRGRGRAAGAAEGHRTIWLSV